MIKPPPLVLMVMEVQFCSLSSLKQPTRHPAFCTAAFRRLVSAGMFEAGASNLCMMSCLMGVQAVCVLRGERPDWDTAKRILGEPNFMRSLLEFDKDNIPESYIRKLRRYVASDPWPQACWTDQGCAQ